MTEAHQVKLDMRIKYDRIGEKVVKEVEQAKNAEDLWHLVEGVTPPWIYYRQRKVETALELGHFQKGATILDVGCGTGDYTLMFARLGFNMIGVDLSPQSIEVARQKAAKLGLREVSFISSDAESLIEIPEESCDGVISFSALRYVPNLSAALRAVWRVLKPKGAAVLDFPNRYCPWFKYLKRWLSVEIHVHDHHYSTKEILNLVQEAGFEEVQVKRILFTPYSLPHFLLPAFKLIDRIGEETSLNYVAAIIVGRGIKP